MNIKNVEKNYKVCEKVDYVFKNVNQIFEININHLFKKC